MSYRIDYIPPDKKQDFNTVQLIVSTLVFSGLFLFLVLLFWEEGKLVLARLFLPAEPQIIRISAETLLQQLQQGTKLDEALSAFCWSIMENVR